MGRGMRTPTTCVSDILDDFKICSRMPAPFRPLSVASQQVSETIATPLLFVLHRRHLAQVLVRSDPTHWFSLAFFEAVHM